MICSFFWRTVMLFLRICRHYWIDKFFNPTSKLFEPYTEYSRNVFFSALDGSKDRIHILIISLGLFGTCNTLYHPSWCVCMSNLIFLFNIFSIFSTGLFNNQHLQEWLFVDEFPKISFVSNLMNFIIHKSLETHEAEFIEMDSVSRRILQMQ